MVSNIESVAREIGEQIPEVAEIQQMDDENGKEGLLTSIEDKSEGVDIKNIMFKYEPHALRKTCLSLIHI